jgi:hypothetical protein
MDPWRAAILPGCSWAAFVLMGLSTTAPLALLKTAGGSRLGARGQIGYRVIVRRDGATVRLFTRRGHDWSERYPAIASAAAKLQAH